MNRRQFLTVAGVATVVGLGKISHPRKVLAQSIISSAHQKVYRGSKDGKLFESLNAGESWAQVADFGEACAIEQIDSSAANGRLTLHLSYQNHSFRLTSADARTWHTS